ncbi:hypothetical protein QQ054_09385 [Oscillatoria amoena NRMC-F 0135]|nr:hypothetical protein [Oscillatoria laete-virens]MDL5046246.1 hypothetical protein [Oscillatoria amoena NRMC-F 0135]MDL5053929.1 hypothetical protein [Oscillatoria laete-virens NRMC-F 0139]
MDNQKWGFMDSIESTESPHPKAKACRNQSRIPKHTEKTALIMQNQKHTELSPLKNMRNRRSAEYQ